MVISVVGSVQKVLPDNMEKKLSPRLDGLQRRYTISVSITSLSRPKKITGREILKGRVY